MMTTVADPGFVKCKRWRPIRAFSLWFGELSLKTPWNWKIIFNRQSGFTFESEPRLAWYFWKSTRQKLVYGLASFLEPRYFSHTICLFEEEVWEVRVSLTSWAFGGSWGQKEAAFITKTPTFQTQQKQHLASKMASTWIKASHVLLA